MWSVGTVNVFDMLQRGLQMSEHRIPWRPKLKYSSLSYWITATLKSILIKGNVLNMWMRHLQQAKHITFTFGRPRDQMAQRQCNKLLSTASTHILGEKESRLLAQQVRPRAPGRRVSSVLTPRLFSSLCMSKAGLIVSSWALCQGQRKSGEKACFPMAEWSRPSHRAAGPTPICQAWAWPFYPYIFFK